MYILISEQESALKFKWKIHHRVSKSTYLRSPFSDDKNVSDFYPQHADRHWCQSSFLCSAWYQQITEWFTEESYKCHLAFLFNSVSVKLDRVCASLLCASCLCSCAVLVFTSVCQSNPFDSHMCPGTLCVTLRSCNVLCLQHYRQKWIWAASAPSLPQSIPSHWVNQPVLYRAEGGACSQGWRESVIHTYEVHEIGGQRKSNSQACLELIFGLCVCMRLRQKVQQS